MSISDYIELLSVLFNILLTIWIVKVLQNKLTNKRSLKDYLIQEIKDLRQEYRKFFNNLCSNNINPQTALSWFKLMNIKIEDFMVIVSQEYHIDRKKLEPFQNDLRSLITENEDYIECFKKDKIKFSTNSIQSIIAFQQHNSKLFNEIIVEINKFE